MTNKTVWFINTTPERGAAGYALGCVEIGASPLLSIPGSPLIQYTTCDTQIQQTQERVWCYVENIWC